MTTYLWSAAMEPSAATLALDVTNVEQRQHPESIDIDWPSPLRQRTGLPQLMDGIDIYFDFDWEKVNGHAHAKIRNGKGLAQRARSEASAETAKNLPYC